MSVALVMDQAAHPDEVFSISRDAGTEHSQEVKAWVLDAPAPGGRFEGALGLVATQRRQDGNGSRPMTPQEQAEEADFARDNSGNLPKSEALSAIAASWRSTGAGFPELRAWLASSGTPEEISAAMERVALATDFQVRMPEHLSFAMQVADAAHREALMHGMYLRWVDTDPENARRFLTTAPREVAEILNAVNARRQP